MFEIKFTVPIQKSFFKLNIYSNKFTNNRAVNGEDINTTIKYCN